MAQENLKQLSKDLSFKIFDPVESGEDDGNIFKREHRLGYISRAYGQLIRILEIIHPNIVRVFRDYYQILNVGDLTLEDESGQTKAAGEGNAYLLDKPYNVRGVYYAEAKGETRKRADFIDPENVLPAKMGENQHYIPSTEDRVWSIINGMVVLLPVDAGYYDVTLFVRNHFPEFAFGTTVDVNIPNDYKDILITMAALEAMSDKGDTTKYELYSKTLTGQLQLIASLRQREDIKEEEAKK